MKAGIIGASEEALHTIDRAKALGVDVVAFDGNEKAAGLKCADYGIVVDISQEEATIQCVKEQECDFLLTVPIGRYLTTIGAVNDALGLPGISKENAEFCTDKYLFHQQLAKEGLRDCDCRLLTKENVSELKVEDFSYPSILKPRFGSGSREIYFLENKEELHKAIVQVKPELEKEDFVLEEAINGTEYGVDAVMERDRFHMVLLRRKLLTPPPARQAIGYLSVIPTSEKELYEGISTYMCKIAKAIGLRDCLLHADLIMTKDKPFVIEVSARPSGHNLHNIFTPMVTGIDMAEEMIKYRLQKEYCFTPYDTKKMMIRYFDLEGRVNKIPSFEEVKKAILSFDVGINLLRWNCLIKEDDYLEAVTTGHSIMGRGYYILEGLKEEKLIAISERINHMFL